MRQVAQKNSADSGSTTRLRVASTRRAFGVARRVRNAPETDPVRLDAVPTAITPSAFNVSVSKAFTYRTQREAWHAQAGMGIRFGSWDVPSWECAGLR